jgi:hypothetical protein
MSTPAQPPAAQQQQAAEKELLHAIWQAFGDHVVRPFMLEAPKWLRYFYFLRFSILLWLFPLALWWANWRGHLRSIVSGILTPVTEGQYLCVSFFLIASSYVALMQARVVAINGEERFNDVPPRGLCWLLAHNQVRYEWVAPVVSQLNTLILFLYFFNNGWSEGVDMRGMLFGLAGGVVLAFCFWYMVTALYYLTWRRSISTATTMCVGNNAVARTLLFPRSWLFLSSGEGKPRFGDVIEDAEILISTRWIAKVFPRLGYKWPEGSLFEGQYFALLAASNVFGLYAVLWPMVAPVPVERWSRMACLVTGFTGVVIVALLALTTLEQKEGEDPRQFAVRKRNLIIWKSGLAALVLGITAAIPYLYYSSDAERFPILALILILATSFAWGFGGFAFFADRFRIPVLTLFLLVLFVPRHFKWTGVQEEHYFSIVLAHTQPQVHTPGEILDSRIALENTPGRNGVGQLIVGPPGQSVARPLHTFIIVTSTGGGIHAAGWTAAVLHGLEAQFGNSFHDNVLLMSTVSGGSAGLYTYLRELDAADHGEHPDWDRMVDEAKCSSLEAVGWGVVYHDVPKSVIPLFPYFWTPSSGIGDLGESPLGKDRTWALRRGFERNLNDSFCMSRGSRVRIPQKQLNDDQAQNPDRSQQLTLAAFNPVAGQHPFPAFTMNTTTVEGGSRFLLANYRVERHDNNALVPQPAESFLDVFGGRQLSPSGKPGYADLPLATAAQLSATFPYVSSAAAFPRVQGEKSAHFVDGGYYDNDGTISAIEFLRAALDGSQAMKAQPSKSGPQAPAPMLRILLVEIRNSLDPSNPNHVPGISIHRSALRDDPNCRAWNLVDQLNAPPKAFYAGGHVSVTARNRTALELLERAYRDQLIVQHFVIDDETNGLDTVSCQPIKDPPTDPLNWSLTPNQQREIDSSVKWYEGKFAQIRSCFEKNQQCPSANQEASQP